jgi:hypothetical protein
MFPSKVPIQFGGLLLWRGYGTHLPVSFIIAEKHPSRKVENATSL